LSAFPSPRENPGAAWYWMLLPVECSCFYRPFLLGGVASADAQDMGELAGESVPECGCFYIRVCHVFILLANIRMLCSYLKISAVLSPTIKSIPPDPVKFLKPVVSQAPPWNVMKN